jgi:hypothetical protein
MLTRVACNTAEWLGHFISSGDARSPEPHLNGAYLRWVSRGPLSLGRGHRLVRSNTEDRKCRGDPSEFLKSCIFVHGHVRPRSGRSLKVSAGALKLGPAFFPSAAHRRQHSRIHAACLRLSVPAGAGDESRGRQGVSSQDSGVPEWKPASAATNSDVRPSSSVCLATASTSRSESDGRCSHTS